MNIEQIQNAFMLGEMSEIELMTELFSLLHYDLDLYGLSYKEQVKSIVDFLCDGEAMSNYGITCQDIGECAYDYFNKILTKQ